MLNFDLLEKGLGTVSPPHFVYDFSRKMFLMSYSIKDTHSEKALSNKTAALT